MPEASAFKNNVKSYIRETSILISNSDDDDISHMLKSINKSLEGLINLEKEYEKICAITWLIQTDMINFYSNSYMSERNSQDHTNSKKILKSIFQILYEKLLRTSETYAEIDAPILKMMIDGNKYLSRDDLLHIESAKFNIQIAIIKEHTEKFYSDAQSMKSIMEEKADISISTMKSYDDNINSFEEKLSSYRKTVTDISKEFNFVRLAKAFRTMIREKKINLKHTNTNLFSMGILLLIPILLSALYTIWLWSHSTNLVQDLKDKLIFSAPILLPLEAILVYYFRIILKEQLSLKAQILQLELRYSVCAFIEGYAEFTKEIPREKLEKFESLVFSGITLDPSAVPGTFDGMDQLINLAKAANGK
ncbi:hypothetical protein [Azospirillum lipoferum]|uniref:hypothetical protein n=1 Tax=Azospirillum lipoferum TaxID=193 RepID=UPI001395FB0D|nr:hypothetical protein [Azospirillum lipoferum]